MTANKAKINNNTNSNFIPLSEAAKRSGYTPEHLNLMSRKGILQAQKIGRNWYTTEEWLNEFLDEVSAKKDGEKAGKIKISRKEEKIPEEVATREMEAILPEEEEKLEDIVGFTYLEEEETKEEEKEEEKKEEKEELKIEYEDKKTKTGWLQWLAGFSSVIIVVPIIFLVVYSARNYFLSKQITEQKISLINQSPQGVIFNENESSSNGEVSQEIVQGVVRGEATANPDDAAKKAGILLASENYKASQVSLGGAVVLAGTEENLPLEISDIKSESFITNKKDGSQNSAEEVKLVVSWKTNKLAVSEIDYSKNNGQNLKTIKEQSFGFNHSVVITQIDPGTSYVFQIKGRDHWGNEIDSDYYGLFTASKPVSIFDLITKQINDIFGWAIKK